MVFEGYARFGGVEVVNSERIRGYSDTSDCPPNWFVGDRCATLQNALSDLDYTHDNIALAPWFDGSLADLSSRFHGVFGLGVTGLGDSTRSASTSEGIDDGGSLGRTRKGMRSARFSVMLAAQGRDALEYGISWLNSAMDAGRCGMHGSACGTTDLEYLVDCPPAQAEGQTDADYLAKSIDPLRRYMHDVSVTSGPLLVQQLHSQKGDYWGALMEWTVTSERAWVYSKTRPVALPVTPTIVIQDTPYNLAKYPSAELSTAGAVVVATNYSTNPSVETNATGWLAVASAVSGSNPSTYLSSGRVTGELSAVGSSSFRARLLGNGSTAASGVANIDARQEIALPALSSVRYSINVWGAAVVTAGAGGSAISSVSAYVDWLNSGGTLLSTEFLGDSSNQGGFAWTRSGIEPPAGAVRARVIVRATANWASSATPANNSDIRLYADALALTAP